MKIETYADEVMTTAEVADYLKVTAGYIYQLKAQRKIPYHKVGKSVRFLRSEIIEWVKTDGASA